MKTIKPIRTGTNGIMFKFQLENETYRMTPVNKGKFDNPTDYAKALSTAYIIAADIAGGIFDKTLEKYKPMSNRKQIEIIEQEELTLLSLWEDYTKMRKKQVTESTYNITYKRITQVITKCPYNLMRDSLKIQQWILETRSATSSNSILMQINACCNWAVDEGKISSNLFVNYKKKINKKQVNQKEEVNPFTLDEMASIIAVFENHPKWNHYYDLIRFLFFMGCRPSEAIALTWNDYKDGCITFNKVFVDGKIQKSLKTQGQRFVKANNGVKNILSHQKDYLQNKRITNTGLIFPSIRGDRHINWNAFCGVVWKGVLKTLPDIRYRSPYNIRHSFITQALTVASIKDVARHCGNSPEVILKHYAGVSRNFVMPEI
jgi:integrase